MCAAMLPMMLAMLVWPALLVVGIVLLVRWFRLRASASSPEPLALLRTRFALGEIDEAKYRACRGVLEAEEER